jgi:hypothetical protein
VVGTSVDKRMLEIEMVGVTLVTLDMKIRLGLSPIILKMAT